MQRGAGRSRALERLRACAIGRRQGKRRQVWALRLRGLGRRQRRHAFRRLCKRCGTDPLLFSSTHAGWRSIWQQSKRICEVVLDEPDRDAVSMIVDAGRTHLLGKLLPTATNSHHHCLRPQDAAEAELGIGVTDPILATLVLPRVRNKFDLDVYRQLVHHIADGNI